MASDDRREVLLQGYEGDHAHEAECVNSYDEVAEEPDALEVLDEAQRHENRTHARK